MGSKPKKSVLSRFRSLCAMADAKKRIEQQRLKLIGVVLWKNLTKKVTCITRDEAFQSPLYVRVKQQNLNKFLTK